MLSVHTASICDSEYSQAHVCLFLCSLQRERLRSDSDTEMEKSMSMRRIGRTCASADFDEVRTVHLVSLVLTVGEWCMLGMHNAVGVCSHVTFP